MDPGGIEPPTLRLSSVRSNQLSYGSVRLMLASLAFAHGRPSNALSEVEGHLLELTRIELATSCLQSRRSPS